MDDWVTFQRHAEEGGVLTVDRDKLQDLPADRLAAGIWCSATAGYYYTSQDEAVSTGESSVRRVAIPHDYIEAVRTGDARRERYTRRGQKRARDERMYTVRLQATTHAHGAAVFRTVHGTADEDGKVCIPISKLQRAWRSATSSDAPCRFFCSGKVLDEAHDDKELMLPAGCTVVARAHTTADEIKRQENVEQGITSGAFDMNDDDDDIIVIGDLIIARENGDPAGIVNALDALPTFRVSHDFFSNTDAAPAITANAEAMLALAQSSRGLLWGYADPALRDDDNLVSIAAAIHPATFHLASLRLRSDKAFVLTLSTHCFMFATLSVRSCRFTVDAIVRRRGSCLRSAAPNLRDDAEIVFLAVTHTPEALRSASSRMRANVDTVSRIVAVQPRAFAHASRSLRYHHRGIATAAVTAVPEMLRYCGASLQDDPAIVMAAVEVRGGALRFASNARRTDPDILEAVTRNNVRSLTFATPVARDNEVTMRRCVHVNPAALYFASPRLRDDIEMGRLARDGGGSLANSSERVQWLLSLSHQAMVRHTERMRDFATR